MTRRGGLHAPREVPVASRRYHPAILVSCEIPWPYQSFPLEVFEACVAGLRAHHPEWLP